MNYTESQNEDFLRSLIDCYYFLEMAIDWIKNNLTIDDVFDNEEIEEYCEAWAESRGYVKQQ